MRTGRSNFRPCARCVHLELGDSEPLARRHEIDAVMRNGGSVGSGGLGSADIHTAIHLHGVHCNDVGTGFARHRHGNVALATRGWRNDGDFAHAHADATDNRVRCVGSDVISSSRPARWKRAASTISTRA